MYFNRLIFALIFKIVLDHNSFAQQFLDPEVIVESLVEEIIEDGNEELDFSEILSRLNYYLKHRIDLNKTDGRELLVLYFLSPFQVQELINYRAPIALFLSIYELQIVSGYDERNIQYLLPF